MNMEQKNLHAIETYLRGELGLGAEQLRYELSRFERHPDIGKELETALIEQRFPKKEDALTVIGSDSSSYTAEDLFQIDKIATIYAAYNLLTQLREHPAELSKALKRGLPVK